MIFRAHPGQAECPQVLGALVMPSPTNELSPAARAQQIICSPGTNYLLHLFALLSSEASVTPPPPNTLSLTHTHTGTGYHSNQDPDLFASFSSLTSKRPIHFSRGKKCTTLKSLINSDQLKAGR